MKKDHFRKTLPFQPILVGLISLAALKKGEPGQLGRSAS